MSAVNASMEALGREKERSLEGAVFYSGQDRIMREF